MWRTSNSSNCVPTDLPPTQARIKANPFNQVYVYNKVGAFFKVQVPRRLRWEGIILDSLDSLQSLESPSADKP